MRARILWNSALTRVRGAHLADVAEGVGSDSHFTHPFRDVWNGEPRRRPERNALDRGRTWREAPFKVIFYLFPFFFTPQFGGGGGGEGGVGGEEAEEGMAKLWGIFRLRLFFITELFLGNFSSKITTFSSKLSTKRPILQPISSNLRHFTPNLRILQPKIPEKYPFYTQKWAFHFRLPPLIDQQKLRQKQVIFSHLQLQFTEFTPKLNIYTHFMHQITGLYHLYTPKIGS